MGNKGADQRKKMPKLPEFVAARDWTGALGLLKFELSVEENLADEGLVTERVSMSCKQSDCHTDRHIQYCRTDKTSITVTLTDTHVNPGHTLSHVSLCIHENSEVDTCTVRTENTSEAASDILLWMAAKLFWMVYCYMHLGAFQEALERLDQVCSLSHSCQFCVTDLPFDVAFAQECKHCILTRTHGTSI